MPREREPERERERELYSSGRGGGGVRDAYTGMTHIIVGYGM